MEIVENLSQEVRGFYVVMSQMSCTPVIFSHNLTAAPQFLVNFVAVQGILYIVFASAKTFRDILPHSLYRLVYSMLFSRSTQYSIF
jgi:hypothetical protein